MTREEKIKQLVELLCAATDSQSHDNKCAQCKRLTERMAEVHSSLENLLEFVQEGR